MPDSSADIRSAVLLAAAARDPRAIATPHRLVHVEIDPEPGRVTVSAGSREVGARVLVPCTTEGDPGRVMVDPRRLLRALAVIDGAPRLHVHGEQLQLRGDDGLEIDIKGQGCNPGDVPVPPLSRCSPVTAPAEVLRAALGKVLRCVAPDDNRYGLNGIHLEPRDGAIGMVTTDGNRLCRAECAVTGELAWPRKALLRRKHAALAVHALRLGEGHVTTLATDDRKEWSATIECGPVTTWGSRQDADFPDYRQVLPRTLEPPVVVDRDALAQALRRVRFLVPTYNETVRLDIKGGRARVVARDHEGSEARCDVPCESPVTRVAGYHAGFLLDALAVLPPGAVHVHLPPASSPLGPTTVQSPADPSTFTIVMPQRID